MVVGRAVHIAGRITSTTSTSHKRCTRRRWLPRCRSTWLRTAGTCRRFRSSTPMGRSASARGGGICLVCTNLRSLAPVARRRRWMLLRQQVRVRHSPVCYVTALLQKPRRPKMRLLRGLGSCTASRASAPSPPRLAPSLVGGSVQSLRACEDLLASLCADMAQHAAVTAAGRRRLATTPAARAAPPSPPAPALPYVTLTYAQALDGSIAGPLGPAAPSRWP